MSKTVYAYNDLPEKEILWLPPELRNRTWAVFENGEQKCSLQPCCFLVKNNNPSEMFAQPEGYGRRVHGLGLGPNCEARLLSN